MTKNASARLTGTASLFAKLDKLPIELRGPIMRKGMQAGGALVQRRAKELVPVGQGRVGKKAGKKHLRDTIGVKVKEYSSSRFSGLVTVVGPEHPAGAHGHLVERGHKAAGFASGGRDVPAYPFMAPALTDTASLVSDAIETAVQEAINTALSKG